MERLWQSWVVHTRSPVVGLDASLGQVLFVGYRLCSVGVQIDDDGLVKLLHLVLNLLDLSGSLNRMLPSPVHCWQNWIAGTVHTVTCS